MPQALARITPQRIPAPAPVMLSNREKAAIIVRLLLAEGAPLPLAALPEHMQAALTEQMAAMRLVDRATMEAVVEEFVGQLESVGLSFPGGLEGALSMLDGHISPSAATRLRRLAGASGKVDPWERIIPLPAERLLPVLEEEAVEVGAVLLSKLPVSKAADLLGKLAGDKARRVAHAVSLTGNIDPDTVRRIGVSLAAQLDAQPPKAFEAGPEERVGAILNVSSASVRDALLDGLGAEDAAFAEKVRKAIFTFGHIPARVAPRDVPKVVRMVDQPVLVTALVGATGPLAPVAEFILSNMSQRMAQGLREEMAAKGKVREKDAEAAHNAVVDAVRNLEAQGEIRLILEDED
ncbi:flagellar motor switch protein FliG [Gemmobacter nectariphilus]|uniref:flagellar motor switch protein FliG n=1 Tax=Gemmobacter nectariphilus TaxID=220343 RepID=UPI000418F33D|nr:FliG C-terminal domain-containing protein [Gemmobacter nectariphilus]